VKPTTQQNPETSSETLHQMLARLKDSEEKFRHLFEKSPVPVYVTDRSGTFLNINDAGVRLLGFSSRDELVGRTSIDGFVDMENRRSYMEILETRGAISDFETRLRRQDGTILDVQLTAALRTGMSGKLAGYEGFILDITDRKRAERELRESEEKYRTVLENSLAAVYMFQKGGIFSYVNQRLVEMLGYSHAGEITGRPFWAFVHPDDREFVKSIGLRREKAETHPQHYTFRALRQDGSTLWVDNRATHASYRGTPAVVGNFIDISQAKLAEKKVRQLSGKLIEVIEEERRCLAADLHDEFGQALTALQFDVDALQTQLPQGAVEPTDRCSRIMERIQELADSIRRTTSRLRPDLLDHLGLIPTLDWRIRDLKKRMPGLQIEFQAIGFKRRLSAKTELALYRIFQEGLNNIIKHAEADRISVLLTCSHPLVILNIRDDGQGFDQGEDGLPLKTGQGIGLLSMKERVASINGTISIQSTRSSGTDIRVELPIAANETYETDTNSYRR